MSLLDGATHDVISENIKQLTDTGVSLKSAIAASLSNARKFKSAPAAETELPAKPQSQEAERDLLPASNPTVINPKLTNDIAAMVKQALEEKKRRRLLN